MDLRVSGWRSDTFNPDKFAEHRELARAAERATEPPPSMPPVTPVALRPQQQPSLTAALTGASKPDVVTDVEGSEARAQLDALFTDEPIPDS